MIAQTRSGRRQSDAGGAGRHVVTGTERRQSLPGTVNLVGAGPLASTHRVRTRYTGYRFPAEIIGHAVWLYFRFPLGLRMVEELLAARGIIVSHETVRQWALKFGRHFANQIRRRLPRVGDKWHLVLRFQITESMDQATASIW